MSSAGWSSFSPEILEKKKLIKTVVGWSKEMGEKGQVQYLRVHH